MTTGMSNAAESDCLKLIGQNTAWANMGNAGGLQPSSVAGSHYVTLHTASPGQAGTQSTNEAAYTSYAREPIARSSGGYTVTGSNPTTLENAVAVTFPACTGGTETETFAAIGQEISGAGEVYFIVTLTASLAVSNGITPSFAIDALTVTLQ